MPESAANLKRVGVQVVEGARRRSSSEGAPSTLGGGDHRPLALCVRLEVEAEGRLTRFEIAVQKNAKNVGTDAVE